MERELPVLTEALLEERAWESDGIVVLTAAVELPQLRGRGAKRFNRYYRRFCRAFFRYCTQTLLPEAAAACRAAMAVSAPWNVARAAIGYTAELFAGTLLSVVCEAREDGAQPLCQRRADIWDLSDCLPVPLEEFFPPHTRCKRVLLRRAREESLRRLERDPQALYENWRFPLRRALNPRNVFLRQDGLCFFYPAGVIAPPSRGIVSFSLPYDSEAGPFLPPAPR